MTIVPKRKALLKQAQSRRCTSFACGRLKPAEPSRRPHSSARERSAEELPSQAQSRNPRITVPTSL